MAVDVGGGVDGVYLATSSLGDRPEEAHDQTRCRRAPQSACGRRNGALVYAHAV